jgi:hypothetical protein
MHSKGIKHQSQQRCRIYLRAFNWGKDSVRHNTPTPTPTQHRHRSFDWGRDGRSLRMAVARATIPPHEVIQTSKTEDGINQTIGLPISKIIQGSQLQRSSPRTQTRS